MFPASDWKLCFRDRKKFGYAISFALHLQDLIVNKREAKDREDLAAVELE